MRRWRELLKGHLQRPDLNKVNNMKFILLIIFFSCAFGMGSKPPVLDKQMSAIAGGDFTAIIEGCGNQLIPGFTYCRITEGSSTDQNLYFVGPILDCNRPNCIDFKIFGTRGEVAFGGSIPKGHQRVAVPWTKLVNRKTFELADRGLWLFTYTLYWQNENDLEEVAISEGEIRLRVVAANYIPLNNVGADANFVWKWITRNGEVVRMTTGMRTYVSALPVKAPKIVTER